VKTRSDDRFHKFGRDLEEGDGAYLQFIMRVHDGASPLFLFNARDIESFDLCGDILVFEACINEWEEPLLLRLGV
jgi:hypothetical protein